MNEKTTRKVIGLIWASVNANFIVTNPHRLETNLRYEQNKTIGQVMAIGLSVHYHISREDIENKLCINPSSYDTKLKVFNRLTGDEEWIKKVAALSRYIRSRTRETFII